MSPPEHNRRGNHPNAPIESITYDEDSGTYHVVAEPGASVEPTAVIYWGIASIEDVNPVHLPPLAQWIDADRLNDLLAGSDSAVREQVTISFTYDGYQITVHGTEEVTVRQLSETDP